MQKLSLASFSVAIWRQAMNDFNEIYLRIEVCQRLISQIEWLLACLTQEVERFFDVDSLIDQLQEFLGLVQETLEELLWVAVKNSGGDVVPYCDI